MDRSARPFEGEHVDSGVGRVGIADSRLASMQLSLLPQSFASNPLDRSAELSRRKEPRFLIDILQGAEFAVIKGNSICVKQAQQTSISWFSTEQLEDDAGFVKHGGVFSDGGGEHYVQISPFLLGRTRDGKYRLALGASEDADVQQRLEQKGHKFVGTRDLMAVMAAEELAVAGHAVALSQWHQSHGFCSRCGAKTVPIEGGTKRACTSDKSHREYPATSPVAIMLVESKDGSSALLGRPKKLRPGVLTCLSGFIEQGESVEEAVAREVQEEAGIPLASIQLLGSQPWPIGRAGSCELMIGCIAKAASDELHPDLDEMEDVRWVKRDAVRQALQESDSSDSPYHGGKSGGLDFFVPPKWAIAHHLIRVWVNRDPWFAKL